MVETLPEAGAAGASAGAHLEKFARFERGHRPGWLLPLRKAGLARFADLGFPTTHDEDWRFTNVTPIARLPFMPVLDRPTRLPDRNSLGQFTFCQLPADRLVFVNGHHAPELSTVNRLPAGVTVSSLAQMLATKPEAVEPHLGRHAPFETNAFTALNTAFFQDGAFIHVPAGIALELPIHLLFVTLGADTGTTLHPRNLVLADKGSRVTILETHVCLSDAAYFTNAVTEVVAGERAAVELCKVQNEGASAYHMAALHANLGRSSDFVAHSIALGARLSRNNIRMHLGGEGLDCVLNGLYVTRGEQLADHHMIVEHAQPHCNSHEYFNGILEGRSRGVFHGRILVRPAAQKTDAKQTNKNLLLSDDAGVDTKPQLEIYADDVKCTHGATIGQLNEEAIFYLRARGLGLDTARRMLIHAFAGEIIDRIRCQSAREELDQVVWQRLEDNPHVRERK